MDPTTAVTVGGYLVLAACMCGFLAMLGKLDIGKWLAQKITAHMATICRASLLGLTLTFFATAFAAYLTVKDPPRMTRYLHNIVVPLWESVSNY